MKTVFISLLLCAFWGLDIQAQDIKEIEFKVIEQRNNNLVIALTDLKDFNLARNRIEGSRVNIKQGFRAQVVAESNQLQVTFSQKFNIQEMITLFEYTGIEITEELAFSITQLMEE